MYCLPRYYYSQDLACKKSSQIYFCWELKVVCGKDADKQFFLASWVAERSRFLCEGESNEEEQGCGLGNGNGDLLACSR